MNQSQAQTALALGLKIRRASWKRIKYIHMVNGICQCDRGIILKPANKRYNYDDWEIYHEPEASLGNDEPGFEGN